MYLQLQFSLFDFRFLQEPSSLVPHLAGWPYVNENKHFLNHFGKVRASIGSVIADKLFPEDQKYIEADNALKLLDLSAADLPFSIEVKMRRLFLDAKGGLKFLIGLNFNFGEHIPFSSLEACIDYFCSLAVEIQLPGKGKKQMNLLKAAPSLKNLYLHASSLANSEALNAHFVQAKREILFLDISERERKHFEDVEAYQRFAFSENRSISYKRSQLKGNRLDIFLTHNIEQHTFNRLLKYQISRLLIQIDNAHAILQYQKGGSELSPKAEEALALQKSILRGEIEVDENRDALGLIESLFLAELDLIFSDGLQKGETDFFEYASREKVREFLKEEGAKKIRKGDLKGLFELKNKSLPALDNRERNDFDQLEFRFNNIQRDFDQNLISLEDKLREESLICRAVLNLLGKL